ncbi:unnamed protein product [Sympodiomycopsis kandeliae]
MSADVCKDTTVQPESSLDGEDHLSCRNSSHEKEQGDTDSRSESQNAKPRMRWTGVMASNDLQRLHREFGGMIICPGYVAQFGRKCDDWGRLYLPGASSGYHESRKIFRRWQTKGTDDAMYNWWPDKLREESIQPITGGDLLDGISLARWSAYRKRYRRIVITRHRRIRRQTLRSAASITNDATDIQDAAKSLLEF